MENSFTKPWTLRYFMFSLTFLYILNACLLNQFISISSECDLYWRWPDRRKCDLRSVINWNYFVFNDFLFSLTDSFQIPSFYHSIKQTKLEQTKQNWIEMGLGRRETVLKDVLWIYVFSCEGLRRNPSTKVCKSQSQACNSQSTAPMARPGALPWGL